MQIYKITNLVTGMVYIGQTTQTLAQRFHGHRYCNDKRGISFITRAIRKYGAENFKIEEIERCSSQIELNSAECKWIAFYNSHTPNGYNLRGGGSNGKLAESTKAKLRNRLVRPETIAKLKAYHQNRTSLHRQRLRLPKSANLFQAKQRRLCWRELKVPNPANLSERKIPMLF